MRGASHPPVDSSSCEADFSAPAVAGARLVPSTKIQHSRTKRTGTTADPRQSWLEFYHMYTCIEIEVTVGRDPRQKSFVSVGVSN